MRLSKLREREPLPELAVFLFKFRRQSGCPFAYFAKPFSGKCVAVNLCHTVTVGVYVSPNTQVHIGPAPACGDAVIWNGLQDVTLIGLFAKIGVGDPEHDSSMFAVYDVPPPVITQVIVTVKVFPPSTSEPEALHDVPVTDEIVSVQVFPLTTAHDDAIEQCSVFPTVISDLQHRPDVPQHVQFGKKKPGGSFQIRAQSRGSKRSRNSVNIRLQPVST